MAKRTISIDQMDNLSVDDETNRLYWRDKEVVTSASLPWWVQIAALLGGSGAFLSGVVAVIKLIKYGA